MSNSIVLEAKALSKSYHDGDRKLAILNHIDFQLRAGQSVALMGSSGSGKSTFLHCLAGLLEPTQGEVFWANRSLKHMTSSEQDRQRNLQLGFIYQLHHLLPEFTALENVAMPLLIRGVSLSQAKEKAFVCLQKMGLEGRVSHKPSQLSGGERQRVAIARAVVTQPLCILADEPTGNLDRETALQVMALLREVLTLSNTALFMVTHDANLTQYVDQVVELKGGFLQSRSAI
jgi:lipoprotein-releasing system ATP-binding protein